MSANTEIPKTAEVAKTPVNTPVAKNSKKGRINSVFQKDPEDDGVVLVPIENIKNSKVSKLKPQSVVELSDAQITTTKYVSEETRLKRVAQGKKLAEFRKNKLIEDAKIKKENAEKEEDERHQRIKEEIDAHKKDIEKKILEGKLVRVKVKTKKEYNKEKRIKDVIPIPKRVVVETEDTDTETDREDTRKSSFKKVQKKIDKKIEEIKKIDETINQYKNPYLDKLMNLMK